MTVSLTAKLTVQVGFMQPRPVPQYRCVRSSQSRLLCVSHRIPRPKEQLQQGGLLHGTGPLQWPGQPGGLTLVVMAARSSALQFKPSSLNAIVPPPPGRRRDCQPLPISLKRPSKGDEGVSRMSLADGYPHRHRALIRCRPGWRSLAASGRLHDG